MSLLINGMDMPKCCDECTFYQDDVYPACKFLWDDFDNYRHPAIERDKNCPLSEIPKPHGRLIDADILLKSVIPYEQRTSAVFCMMKNIENAPTIIEKEDE